MDPHSRHSQFNKRQPKSGPQSRSMPTTPLPASSTSHPLGASSILAPFAQTFPTKMKQKAPAPSIRRPIVTNSRIRQQGDLRRDMHLAFVNNALQEKTLGRSGPFDELVNQFNFKSNPTSAPSQIRFWISALSHVVSKLERTHSALVEAIVNMPWTLLDDATVRLYTVFIGMLLSARPEYLSLVLAKIVQGFTHRTCIIPPTWSSCLRDYRTIYPSLGPQLLCTIYLLIAASQSSHAQSCLRPSSLSPSAYTRAYSNTPVDTPTTPCQVLPPQAPEPLIPADIYPEYPPGIDILSGTLGQNPRNDCGSRYSD